MNSRRLLICAMAVFVFAIVVVVGLMRTTTQAQTTSPPITVTSPTSPEGQIPVGIGGAPNDENLTIEGQPAKPATSGTWVAEGEPCKGALVSTKLFLALAPPDAVEGVEGTTSATDTEVVFGPYTITLDPNRRTAVVSGPPGDPSVKNLQEYIDSCLNPFEGATTIKGWVNGRYQEVNPFEG